jgi:hypothetical protein
VSEISATGKAPVHDYPKDEASLWSEILPGLWLGGTDDADTIEHALPRMELEVEPRVINITEFQSVVTAYAYARPADWLVEEFRYAYYDADDITHIDLPSLYRAATYARDAWKSGRKTLVRCQAGLNRSGLIMAVVLLMDGYTAEDAIHLMRTRRSRWVLCNETFERFIYNIEESKKERNENENGD